LKYYRDSLAIGQRLVSLNPTNGLWQNDLQFVIGRIARTGFSFILAHDFTDALDAANQAIAAAPNETWLYLIRAHALMFLGQTAQARALYVKYRGQKIPEAGGKLWEAVVVGDFTTLRAANLTNPLMDEIEKEFTSAG
jgi:hypothetical protein